MPRVADHDARRAQLAGAALAIALDQGLDRVSVPRIAQKAGVSVGLVQHYFPAKSELVVVAYQELAAQVDVRIAALVQEGEARGRPIRDLVVDALSQLLPLDEDRAQHGRVRAEFAARALRDADLAAVAHRLHVGLLKRIGTAVDNGRVCGETDPDVQTSSAAAELLALAEGLAGARLLERGAADGADLSRALLAAASRRIFPGRCALGGQTHLPEVAEKAPVL